jgi:hypothetical protein
MMKKVIIYFLKIRTRTILQVPQGMFVSPRPALRIRAIITFINPMREVARV